MNSPWGASPYGDDPADQIQIKRGYWAYFDLPVMVRKGYRPYPFYKQ